MKIFLSFLILLIVSCNNSSEVPVTAAPAKPVVPMIPGMGLISENGQALNLADFKGKKVFVNLWATWCPPCRAEMPSIQKLAGAVDSNKVKFVMLSLDENFETARTYAANTNLTLPIYAAATGLPSLFQTPGIPVTYIFNEAGELIFRRDRADNYDQPQFVDLLNK